MGIGRNTRRNRAVRHGSLRRWLWGRSVFPAYGFGLSRRTRNKTSISRRPPTSTSRCIEIEDYTRRFYKGLRRSDCRSLQPVAATLVALVVDLELHGGLVGLAVHGVDADLPPDREQEMIGISGGVVDHGAIRGGRGRWSRQVQRCCTVIQLG